MPRSGGIAIVFTFIVGLLFLDVPRIFSFLMPLLLVFGMGLWDDIFSISSRIKLFITAIAGAWLFVNGFEIIEFGHFFGNEIVFSYGISLVSSSLILSIWFYNKNKEFIPKISSFNIKKMKSF